MEPDDQPDRSACDESVEVPTGLNRTFEREEDRDPLDIDIKFETDPLEDQVRDDPNPELVHQYDEKRDPLDLAVIAEHQHVDQDKVSPVQEGQLNPPPVDEYD